MTTIDITTYKGIHGLPDAFKDFQGNATYIDDFSALSGFLLNLENARFAKVPTTIVVVIEPEVKK